MFSLPPIKTLVRHKPAGPAMNWLRERKQFVKGISQLSEEGAVQVFRRIDIGTQELIIGVVGTVVGASAGALIANVLDRYRLISIPSDVYQVTYLPFKLLPWDAFVVVAGAVVVCFFATLYPSRQAARLDPAQALALIASRA